FVSESRQQGALLERVAKDDLREFNEFTEGFIGVSEAHGALFALLDNARSGIAEDKLYDLAKTRLDQVRAAVGRLRATIESHQKEDVGAGRDISPETALLNSLKKYMSAVSTAVEVTTVDVGLASVQLRHANNSFIELARTFNDFLDTERR